VPQIGAYSKVNRDPRDHTITIAYLAVADTPLTIVAQDDATKAEWFPINALPSPAFDHDEILTDAIGLYNNLMK